MSFILDALKKTEDNAAANASAAAPAAPTGPGGYINAELRESSRPLWPWVVGFALLINSAITFYYHFGSNNPVPVVANVAPANPPVTVAQLQEQSRQHTAAPDAQGADEQGAEEAASSAPTPKTGSNLLRIEPGQYRSFKDAIPAIPLLAETPPSFQETLPALAVDMHVYAKNPAHRFALINMIKYKEGAQIRPNLILEEITPHGLILSFNGNLFRLEPRR